jgi:hypothetical protein
MDTKVMTGLVLLAAGIMDLVMAVFLPRRIPDPGKQKVMRGALGGGGAILLVAGTLLAARIL